jgi:GTP-binding protein
MFLDEAELDVKGGDGGNGVVAFRREKFVPRGGPSGGSGGRGGNVVLVADEGVNTLHAFRFTKLYAADRGGHGRGSDKHGKDGTDLLVTVPAGTIVRDTATGDVVADMVEHGQQVVVARGGRGGRGNTAFKSATHQAPRFAEKGEPGQARRLKLELKLLADVGLVGLPNAGKSTLLSVVSAAQPKVADYPFTTLAPILGVAEIGHETLVFADMPGLIEGASDGAGLGDRFLRHVERTRLLVHLVDGTAESPAADFVTINDELSAFSPELAERPQIVVVTKIDLPEARERLDETVQALQVLGVGDITSISAPTREGVAALLKLTLQRFKELPPPERPADTVPVLRPVEEDEDQFDVEQVAADTYRVKGVRIERTAAMTDWGNEDAVRRFQRVLEAMGVASALREAGAEDGDTVAIGEFELEWVE